VAEKRTTIRRVIMNAKINAWEKLISNLIPKKGQKELCAFTKLMTGRGFNNSAAGQVLLLEFRRPSH
jgi:hypothetical protein